MFEFLSGLVIFQAKKSYQLLNAQLLASLLSSNYVWVWVILSLQDV
jgi:hypothetical protein